MTSEALVAALRNAAGSLVRGEPSPYADLMSEAATTVESFESLKQRQVDALVQAQADHEAEIDRLNATHREAIDALTIPTPMPTPAHEPADAPIAAEDLLKDTADALTFPAGEV